MANIIKIIPLLINNAAGTATLQTAPGAPFKCHTMHVTLLTSATVADRSMHLAATTTGTILQKHPITKAFAAGEEMDISFTSHAGAECYWRATSLIGQVATGGVGNVCPEDVRLQIVLDNLQTGDVMQSGWATVEYL